MSLQTLHRWVRKERDADGSEKCEVYFGNNHVRFWGGEALYFLLNGFLSAFSDIPAFFLVFIFRPLLLLLKC